MPLQSRDWTTLGLLAAGTVTVGGASNAEFNVMGIDWTQNDFRLDGIDDNSRFMEAEHSGSRRQQRISAFVPPPMPFRNSSCRLATSTLSTATPRAGSLMPCSSREPIACMGIFGNTFEIRSSMPTTTSPIRPIRHALLITKTSSAEQSEDPFTSPSSITEGTGPSSLIIRAPGSVHLRPEAQACQLP